MEVFQENTCTESAWIPIQYGPDWCFSGLGCADFSYVTMKKQVSAGQRAGGLGTIERRSASVPVHPDSLPSETGLEQDQRFRLF